MADLPRFAALPEGGMWSSFKLDCEYCRDSLKRVAAEHDWSSMTKSLLWVDKSAKELLGQGVVCLLCLGFYGVFLFPFLGIVWTLVIALAIVCAFFWASIHSARVRYDIETREHDEEVSALRSELSRVNDQLCNVEVRHQKSVSGRLTLQGEYESLQASLTEVRSEIATLKQRPEITGGFHDLMNTYYYEKSDQEFPKPVGTQVILSTWLRNNNHTPTTLHNFRLQWEALDKTWIAHYADEVTIHQDRDIWPTNEIAQRNSNKVNLSSFLGSKSIIKDARVEGYLVFRLEGMGMHVEGLNPEDLPQEGWPITLTLYIEDAWGVEHVIRDPMFKSSRPSLRLSDRSAF